MKIFQALRQTVLEEAAPQSVPSFLHTTVDLLGKAHTCCRTIKLLNVFTKAQQNPQRGHPAIYGAALQLAGDYTSLGYGLNVALLAKCAQDILSEYASLSQSYLSFKAVIQCHYPLYQPVHWKKASPQESLLFSPSFLIYRVELTQLIQKIDKIVQCVLDMLWQSFRLSMALRDAYLVFEGDPLARYEACTELIANWDDYQRHLKNHQELLVEELEKGQALADRILTRLNLHNTQFILYFLKNHLPQNQNVKAALENVLEAANRAADTVYIPGKVTPLHIDLAEGQDQPPALAPGRFPPWAGQEVEIKTESSQTSSSLELEEESEHDLFSQLFLPLAAPLKGIMYVAQNIKQIYQKQLEEPIHPCV